MAAKRELYQATFSFGYGRYGLLDAGQVVELQGLENDAKLVQHRYLVPLPARAETYQCQCGAEFATAWQRTAHGDKRHPKTWMEQREAAEVLARREDRHHPELQRI